MLDLFFSQSHLNGFPKTFKGISNGARLLLEDDVTQPAKMHLTNFPVVVVELVCPHFVWKATVLWLLLAGIPFLVSTARLFIRACLSNQMWLVA